MRSKPYLLPWKVERSFLPMLLELFKHVYGFEGFDMGEAIVRAT